MKRMTKYPESLRKKLNKKRKLDCLDVRKTCIVVDLWLFRTSKNTFLNLFAFQNPIMSKQYVEKGVGLSFLSRTVTRKHCSYILRNGRSRLIRFSDLKINDLKVR